MRFRPWSSSASRAPEPLVQAAVDSVDPIVDRSRVGVRRVAARDPRSGRGDRAGDVGEARRRRRRRRAPRRAPGSGRVGNAHAQAARVGEQLHRQRALFGDPAAGDDLVQLQAVLLEVLDDPPVAERDRLEQRAVDLLARRLQRQPDEHAAEVGVGEDRAVAVPPVERDEPGRAGTDRGRRLLERRVLGIGRRKRLHEPGEHVADRRLPGLVAVEAGQDAVAHDAGDPGQPHLVGVDHEVADRGPDDHHERSRLTRPRRPGPRRTSRRCRPRRRRCSGSPSRAASSARSGARARAERRELRAELLRGRVNPG